MITHNDDDIFHYYHNRIIQLCNKDNKLDTHNGLTKIILCQFLQYPSDPKTHNKIFHAKFKTSEATLSH